MDDEATRRTRARWLRELDRALREAEQLTSALIRWRAGSAEAIALRIRIMAARTEVEALRRGGIDCEAPTEAEPLWTIVERPRRPRPDPIP